MKKTTELNAKHTAAPSRKILILHRETLSHIAGAGIGSGIEPLTSSSMANTTCAVACKG